MSASLSPTSPTPFALPRHIQLCEVWFSHYSALPLNPVEILNFSWCITNPIETPFAVKTSTPYELRRGLNRLWNMTLLRQGKYEEFIAPQKDPVHQLKNGPEITPEQFKFFSDFFKESTLSEEALLALRAITIAHSVTLTKEAREAASMHPAFKHSAYPIDSVDFLKETTRHSPEIYPLFKTLNPTVNSETDVERTETASSKAQYLFQHAFDLGHGRHPPYVEGNQGMFKALLKFLEAYPDPEKFEERVEIFNFWFMQWLINISGFTVKTDDTSSPAGSLHLNQYNAEALIQLYHLYLAAIRDPSQVAAILPHYLTFRKTQLGAPSLTDAQMQVLAWLQIYNLDLPNARECYEAVKLHVTGESPAGFNTLTPTYVPALFVNCLEALKEAPEKAIFIAYKIYKTMLDLSETRSADFTSETPLSFRKIADKKFLQDLVHNPEAIESLSSRLRINPSREVEFMTTPESAPLARLDWTAAGATADSSKTTAP